MWVALCRLTFALPGNRSLKGKRQVVRRVVDRLRSKFHATAAEVGDPEVWSEAAIGFALVSPSRRFAEGMAENVLGHIEDLMIAPLREVELEVVAFDDLTEGGSWGEMERWAEGADAKISGDDPAEPTRGR